MEKLTFELKTEYINLVQLLKYFGIISTGGEIVYYLDNNLIQYNSEIEYRKRKKIYAGDIITIDEKIQINVTSVENENN